MTSNSTTTPLDLSQARAKARWAYERARLKRALLGVVPLAFAVGLAIIFASRPRSTVAFSFAALSLGVFMLWYGREPKRGFLWGAAAGSVPLALATLANHVHVCGPTGCATWCVQACCTGGLVAGLVLAYQGHKRSAGMGYWLSASGLALLVGAAGCACIGAAGVVGLVAGFAVGMIPALLRRSVPRV